MQQVLDALGPFEPNYRDAATKLGAEALPFLERLIEGRDVAMAANATSLTTGIDDRGSARILKKAAMSRHDIVRVCAATGIRNMRPSYARESVGLLLEDRDSGVRKCVLKSIILKPDIILDRPELRTKVKKMVMVEQDPINRKLLEKISSTLPP